jgi:hypothetical protein
MGPAVVPGQDLTEAAGPVRDGAVADLATGDRQLGNGHREAAEGDLLICLYDASPAGVILPLSLRRMHSTRQMRAGILTGVLAFRVV